MNLSIRKFIPAAVGVILCTTLSHSSDPITYLPIAPAGEPGRLEIPTQTEKVSANQRLANAIEARLGQLRQLQGYRIDISVNNGVVDLLGFVSKTEHLIGILNATREVPGVLHVVNRVRVLHQNPVQRTQLLQPPTGDPQNPVNAGPPLLQNEPGPQPLLQNNQPNPGQGNQGQGQGNNGNGPSPLLQFQNQPQEPTPIYQPQPQGPTAQGYHAPKLPPYAWPTYAPYNNYSRVAYPLSYPYQSWPYIGPIYPYPKIPLGWRSVSLTWQDGFWWYGRNSTGYDWWRLRFW